MALFLLYYFRQSTTTVFNHLILIILTSITCLRRRHLQTLRNHTFTHRASPRLRTLQTPTLRITFMTGVCPTRHLRTTVVATRASTSGSFTMIANLISITSWNHMNTAAHTKIIRCASYTVRLHTTSRWSFTCSRVCRSILPATTPTPLTGTKHLRHPANTCSV